MIAYRVRLGNVPGNEKNGPALAMKDLLKFARLHGSTGSNSTWHEPLARQQPKNRKRPGGQTGRRAGWKIQARKKAAVLFDQHLAEFHV
jgi:hypothetical protein